MTENNYQPTYSRLQNSQAQAVATHQLRRKYWWQIILFLVISLVLVLVFLIWIFPGLVHYTGLQNSQKYTPEKQQIKPQVPLFNAPPQFTNEDTLKITGFGTPMTQVQFIINGKKEASAVTSIGVNGEFSLVIRLQTGENRLSAYSFDDQNLESSETKTYQVTLDQQVPEIQLLEPTETSTTVIGKDKKNFVVKGKTEPNAKILVNNLMGKANNEGDFEVEYQLNEGLNQIQLIASDQAENQTELALEVDFKP